MRKRYSYYLGIDPGIKNIGSALLSECGEPVDLSVIVTPKIALHARLEIISSQFQEIPDCMLCFEIQPNGLSKDILIALGYIIAAVKPSWIVSIAPKALKKVIAGSGNAGKKDVIEAVNKRLSSDIQNNHIADAAACAIYAFKSTLDLD